MKSFALHFLLVIFAAVAGCGGPSIRMGAYASRTMGTGFPDPKELGQHNSKSEKNGQVYTCRAGHIDLAHLRKAADWTVIFTDKTYKSLMENDKKFKFKLREPSVYYVTLSYPANWKYLPKYKKEPIARDLSIELGRYFAYTASTWHEIITWFGYKCSGLYSEFPSAFSWEDTMSNLLGTYVASQAMLYNKGDLDKAITVALDKQLEQLGVQPKEAAEEASDKVKGDWYSGGMLFFVKMKKRNFDIGIDDGFVTPWIVPTLGSCNKEAKSVFLAPNVDSLSDYGFSMKLEIRPKIWESKKILKIVYPNKKRRKNIVNPSNDFALIMDHIEKEALEKYGPYVQTPIFYSAENHDRGIYRHAEEKTKPAIP